jgi:excinuclease ABC subunit C
MRPPRTALPGDLDSVPDRPAVFLLWASEGAPYLARTALLRRRLRRILSPRNLADSGRLSGVLNLRGVIERIEYWPTGSRLESSLLHLELAQRYFPQDWARITRLQAPVFVRLHLDNAFPRMTVTSRIGRGLYYGPFPSRAAADRFETGVLDLFQLRRCEENLTPAPEHPGCVYGEMNRCLRPCQAAVSIEEYRSEAVRVEQFLRTGGASLLDTAETARDRASAEMNFEDAERWHTRAERIAEVQSLSGDLAREVSRLHGVAVVPSADESFVDLWVMAGGRWLEPRHLALGETADRPAGSSNAGSSMDHRMRDLLSGLAPGSTENHATPPHPEHLAILMRWYSSSWRDGEWIGMESLEKIPYRKLVNAAGRVAAASLEVRPRAIH